MEEMSLESAFQFLLKIAMPVTSDEKERFEKFKSFLFGYFIDSIDEVMESEILHEWGK